MEEDVSEMQTNQRGFVDYYSVLGAQSTDSLANIRKAFIQRARETHPDKNIQINECGMESSKEQGTTDEASGECTSSEFVLVREAFDVLSNDNRRKEYDTKRLMYYNNINRGGLSRKTFAVDCVVDLDEMTCSFDDAFKLYTFSKSCRCGEKLKVNEDELEQNLKAVEDGNVAKYKLQCPTCSFVTLVQYEQSHDNSCV